MTAAATLPVMELRPGLKDVRRSAELMHAYITLSLLTGLRTEEARALQWAHVDLDGDPAARLVGHATTRTTEIVYRRELRPVITTGAEIMDQLFRGTGPQQGHAAPRRAPPARHPRRRPRQDPAITRPGRRPGEAARRADRRRR
jgi:hypothetical protein